MVIEKLALKMESFFYIYLVKGVGGVNTQLVRSSGLPVCYIAMTSMLLSRRAVDCQHVAANDQQVDTSKSLAADCETNRQSPRNDTLPVRIVAIVLVSSRSNNNSNNNNNKSVGDWFARS